MSQYKDILSNKREVLFGLDKPLGGYFLTIFFTNDEITDDEHDLFLEKDGLTLTQLVSLLDQYEILFSQKSLINDYFVSDEPTPMQLKISKMFGRDVVKLLKICGEDIKNNWMSVK